MRKGLTLVAVMFIAAIVPLWSSGKGDPAAGKAAYTKKCAICHGAAGEGKEAIAKMMKVELRHLGSKEVQALSDADVKKIIVAGKGKMKPVTGLSEKETADILAFVRSLAKK